MGTFIATSSILAASILFLLGLFVSLNGRKELNFAFGFYMLSISVFSYGIYGLASGLESTLYFWVHILAIGLIFIPSTYLIFFKYLLEINSKFESRFIYSSLVVSILMLISVFTDTLYVGVKKVLYGYMGEPGPVFPFFIVGLLICLVYGQTKIHRKIKTLPLEKS